MWYAESVNYSRTQFYRLMEAVEDQGGDHVDRVCAPTPYYFKQHTAEPGPDDNWKITATGATKKVTFPSCGHSAIFEVPYVSAEDDEEQTVTVCAVEDSMGLWPRFADQVAG